MPMTKQRLEQFHRLRQEVATLERCIEDAPNGTERVTDAVQGSHSGFPYNKHKITIEGSGESLVMRRLKKRLGEKKARLAEELDAIMEYIDSLEDSVVRQIVTLRYVEGLAVCEVAGLVGYSERQISRIIKAAFAG